jgi:ferrochelatase
MSFDPEPQYTHGRVARTAVLLVNLGTPASPEPAAVRRYLKEFLADPRVVEIPRAIWLPILYGVILTVRPKKSAAKYAAIWTEQGSPLLFHSEQQALLLRGYLGDRGLDVDVRLAMRYGEPSIPRLLAEMREAGIERVLVLPLYPQYSATTTATVFDAIHAEYARYRNVPEVREVKHFHDHLGYIEALRRSVLDHWARHGSLADAGGKLVMSFHGVPRRTLDLGDPYHCECLKTGRLLAESLGLQPQHYVVTFQSRFGKAEWLQPYTAPTLRELGRQGVPRVDVICPGFVADCLETLEEINIEGRAEFGNAGGKTFHYIACLNESAPFIHALVDLTTTHLQGWPVQRSGRDAREAQAALSAAEAKRAGAPR